MIKTQCWLAIVAFSINHVYSWDFAVTAEDQIDFYTNGTKTNNQRARFRELTALAYDTVHNMMLFVDKQSDNASIFSYHLAQKKYQPLVRKKSNENIQGIAFDPVESKLFWIDSNEKSIFSMSLKPGSKNNYYGDLVIKMDDEIPRAIAVDSCRGYIYWTNINTTCPTIERARFDGTDRELIVKSGLFMPMSIAIDQSSRKLYWANDQQGYLYSIESSDLDGKNREIFYKGDSKDPQALAVSKDSVYWVDIFYSIWRLNKNNINSTSPPELVKPSDYKKIFGIVTNYQIDDQTNGIPECESLKRLSQNTVPINDTFTIPADMGLFCLNGMKEDRSLSCKCSPGYSGDRCQISLCQNYCLQGDCSITSDGEPTCRCKNGYTGSRCELNVCHGYCLNNGNCFIDDKQNPQCKCLSDYKGLRCETLEVFTTTTTYSIQATADPFKPRQAATSDLCNCTSEQNFTKLSLDTDNNVEFLEAPCNLSWDPIRDPILMVLGLMCGILCLSCAVLSVKFMKLKKRPRIVKKRIIVNKNGTPLTARPDQCEITIENCCNMNICETPCFEPRSTIRPTLIDAKPGKEEKKTLISNMELPDDY